MADGQVVFSTELDAAGVKNGLDSLNGTINKWGKAIVGGKALQIIGDAIVDFAKAGIEYNAQMETYQTNFSVMLGDQAKALEHVTSLKEMAAKTPFGMAELASASQTLLSFGANADTVMGNLQMLGDIALGDKEKLSSLSLAFAQVSAAGKLTGQDLLQMVNAGFNPLNTIAERTGTNLGDLKEVMGGGAGSKEFRKAMKAAKDEVKKLGSQASEGAKLLAQIGAEGMISAEMVGKAMQLETSPGGRFYNGMEQASKTMQGLWSTLKDDSMELVGNTMEGLSNVLTSKVLPSAINVVGAINGVFDKLESAKISVETQDAIDKVNALDLQITDIKEKYTTEAISIRLDYENAKKLLTDLDTLSTKLRETPQDLWSAEDQAQLAALNTQLGELIPNFQSMVDKDGLLKKEYEEVVKLTEEYYNLALAKAAANAMEQAYAAQIDADLSVKTLEKRVETLNQERKAATETAKAYENMSTRTSELWDVFEYGQYELVGTTRNEAFKEAAGYVQQYVDAYGSLANLELPEGFDSTLILDSMGVVKSMDEIASTKDSWQGFMDVIAALSDGAETALLEQANIAEGLTNEISLANQSLEQAKTIAAEAAAYVADMQGVTADLAAGNASVAEAAGQANAAIDGVATKAAEATAEPYTVELEPDDQASGTIDKVEQDLSNLNGKGATVYINVETTGGVPTDVSDLVDGSHAGGLEYVPYDNYVALLHKGERVLTAAEADALRTLNGRDVASELANRTFGTSGSGLIGSSNTIVNQTVNFNTPVETPDEVAQAMKMYATYGLTGA